MYKKSLYDKNRKERDKSMQWGINVIENYYNSKELCNKRYD